MYDFNTPNYVVFWQKLYSFFGIAHPNMLQYQTKAFAGGCLSLSSQVFLLRHFYRCQFNNSTRFQDVLI
jgi:hypothetical protein